MPKFIIRRVQTLEVEADSKEEAAFRAQNYDEDEELSIDYYYDSDHQITEIYEPADWHTGE